MFKISYKELRSNSFRTALSKLTTSTDLDFTTAYRLARLAKELERAYAQSQKEWVAVAEPLLLKDEKGLFKIDESGFHYKEDVDKEDAEKRIGAYLDTQVQIDRLPLQPKNLHPAKLSPADYVALEPILEDNP